MHGSRRLRMEKNFHFELFMIRIFHRDFRIRYSIVGQVPILKIDKNLAFLSIQRRAEPGESRFTIAMTLTSPFLGLDMTNLKFPDISRFLVFYNSEYDSKGKGELTWPTKERGQGYK